MANDTLNKVKNIFSKSEQSYSPLSYGTFLNDRERFRRSGGAFSDEFNIFDTPSQKYFKIFFYFLNDTSDMNRPLTSTLAESTGLLAPTWELKNTWSDDDYFHYTSAWAYLKMNNDEERAELLQKFIYLLSNISTYSPWYFTSVEGIDGALNRNAITGREFKIDEERKKITIQCLPDAYDNRIGTLLDLYRTIAFSWQQKKEILPANLRKFDMGIYIFESPIKNIHGDVNTANDKVIRSIFGESDVSQDISAVDKSTTVTDISNYATIGDKSVSSKYLTSYKYIEFHNCEIDINSSSTAWQGIKNDDGITPTYRIDINFDDCYEYSYNEFLMRNLGDVIMIDSAPYNFSEACLEGWTPVESEPQVDDASHSEELYKRSNIYKSKSFTESVISELTGSGMRFLKNKTKKITLGNIYSFSLSKLKDQIDAFNQGHILSTTSAVKKYVNNSSVKNNANMVKSLGNIYKTKSIGNNI